MKKKIITASFAMMLFVSLADVAYVHDPELCTLTATVTTGDAEFDDAASLALLTGNSVTNFVKAGAGRLIVPYDTDLSSYAGGIRVVEGAYRYQHVRGLGKTSAAVDSWVVVEKGAQLESYQSESSTDKADFMIGKYRKFRIAGDGPDGSGALLFSQRMDLEVNNFIGGQLELTDDACITVVNSKAKVIRTTSAGAVDLHGHDLRFNVKSRQISFENPKVVGGGGRIVFMSDNKSDQHQIKFSNLWADGYLGKSAEDLTLILSNKCYICVAGSNGNVPAKVISALDDGDVAFLTGNKFDNETYPSNAGMVNGVVNTNYNRWMGPVDFGNSSALISIAPYDSPRNAIALHGKISGSKRICAKLSDSSPYGALTLMNPENDFADGITLAGADLWLWRNGTVPADGGTLVVTNGSIQLYGSDAYSLPDTEMHGDVQVAVTNGFGMFKGITKTGKGLLDWHSLASAGTLKVEEGQVALTRHGLDPRFAGLVYGFKNCHKHVQDDPESCFTVWQSSVCFTNSVVLRPEAAYVSGPSTIWGEQYPVLTYSGYIWNRTGENARWSFASCVNTGSMLFIDGEKVITQQTTSAVGTNTVEVTPGPHRFEYRIFANKDGVTDRGGPAYYYVANMTNTLGSSSGTAHWAPNFGLGWDPQGRNSNDCADYQELVDPGDGSLLTWSVPEEAGTAVAHPITGEPIYSTVPYFASMDFAVGSSLDAGGNASQATMALTGFPSLTACPLFRLQRTWSVDVAEIRMGAAFTSDGAVSFAEGSGIVVTGFTKPKLPAGRWYEILVADGGVDGMPSVTSTDGNAYAIAKSEDGKSLSIKRIPVGTVVVVR